MSYDYFAMENNNDKFYHVCLICTLLEILQKICKCQTKNFSVQHWRKVSGLMEKQKCIKYFSQMIKLCNILSFGETFYKADSFFTKSTTSSLKLLFHAVSFLYPLQTSENQSQVSTGLSRFKNVFGRTVGAVMQWSSILRNLIQESLAGTS